MRELNEATAKFNEAILVIKEKWEERYGPLTFEDIQVLLAMYKEGMRRGTEIAIQTITREYC